MATKDHCLFLKNKQNLVVNDKFNDQFNNLNLNQSNQCFFGIIQSENHENHKKEILNYAFKASLGCSHCDNSQAKQTSFGNPKFSLTNPNIHYGKKEELKEGKTLNANSSTLSLHITAYENSMVATSGEKDEINKKKEKISSIKKWKAVKDLYDGSASAVNYAFELPRQQQDQNNDPEVMQFKASQRLSNLNGVPSASFNAGPSTSNFQPRPTPKTMALSAAGYAVKKKDKYGGSVILDSKSLEESQQNLSLYQNPPTEIISLQEFEEYGRLRMKVLKKIEYLREKFRQGSQEYKDAFEKQITPLMPLATGRCFKNKEAEERRKDRISHFILRMAFCQSAEQTKWFIQQEVELFRSRFTHETQDNIMTFLRVNNFELEQVNQQEKRQFMKQLSAGSKIPEEQIEKTEFWKVEFTRAFELIRGRKVFLWKGMIYITFKELIAVIATRLRLVMAKAMAKEAMNMGRLNEEERLIPMLRRLTKIETNSGYTHPKNPNEITPQMVDELSKKSFPPCMKHIHSNLRQEHHLRHFARRQYGLFLKDAGMSLESSLEFFRKEFTKKIDSNKFDKEYAYNIRHYYGKEGAHREGTGYSCTKIILTNPPAAQDCHGCPFRHCDPGMLPQRLQTMGLTNEEAQKVATISNQKRYDIACARFFEYHHQMEEGALGAVITHPNQYFEASRQIYDGKRSRSAKSSQEIHLTIKKKDQQKDSQPMKDEFEEEMEF